MAGFNISPASLRHGADGLGDMVDRTAVALTTLETKLHGYASPWGTGVVGMAIGMVYEAIHDMALSSYEQNAEVISEYAQGLESMAETLQEREQEIESGLLDVGSNLASGFPGQGRP